MSDVETTVLYFERKKAPPSRPETSVELEARLIALLKAESRFVSGRAAGIAAFVPDVRKGDERGRLLWEGNLFGLLQTLGLEEADEDMLLKVLDQLAGKQQLRIVEIRSDFSLNHRNFLIKLETGSQWRGLTENFVVPVVKASRFFFDSPLSKSEIPKTERLTLMATDVIKNLRERQERHLRATFGTSDEATLLAAMHREDAEQTATLKKAILSLLEESKK